MLVGSPSQRRALVVGGAMRVDSREGEVAATLVGCSCKIDTPPRSRGRFRHVLCHATLPIPPYSHRGPAGHFAVPRLVAAFAAGKARRRAPFGVHSRPRLALSAPHPGPGHTSPGGADLCAAQRTPDVALGPHREGAFTRTPWCGCYVLSPHHAPVRPGDPKV